MKKIKSLSLLVKSIFLLIALFFTFGIYLSIPVLYNYKSIQNIIEKKFYSDFNIKLNINGDIKYQLLPKPHLLIGDSSISIIENNDIMLVDIYNLKIFLNSNSLYPKSKIDFEKFEIQNTNFLLKGKEFNILRNYFHKSETKPFYILKSKIFVLDDNKETLAISPIEKISFNTSKKDNLKKLNIKGNIFDLNFKSLWKKKFNTQMNSQLEIDFQEPNLTIKNKLKYKNKSNLKGSITLNFLNESIDIDYILNNKLITLKSPDNNNIIKTDTIIELRPFYLNSKIILNKQNLNFLIDDLVYSLLNLKSELLGNLNGELKLSFTNIEHELIRNGQMSFDISEKTIQINNVIFNLGEIGIIESDIKYDEQNGNIVFNSTSSLIIKNKKEFARKFQVKPKKVVDLDKIFFKIQKNINNGSTSIYDIKISKSDYKDSSGFKYQINNSQELKALAKKFLNK